AGRMTLIREVLTECIVLATTAAAGGVSLAWLPTRPIPRGGNTNIPRIAELAPDASLLLFGIAASGVTALVFGLVPAVLASSGSLAALCTGRRVDLDRS